MIDLRLRERGELDPGIAPDPGDVLAGAEDIGLELLLAWIADGPPRPPESREELEAWARERGLLGDPTTERG